MEELLAISLALHADGREKITFVGRGVYRVGQDLLLELKTTDLPLSIVALSKLDQAKPPWLEHNVTRSKSRISS